MLNLQIEFHNHTTTHYPEFHIITNLCTNLDCAKFTSGQLELSYRSLPVLLINEFADQHARKPGAVVDLL